MIHDGTAYFAAERSTFLDGGIAVFGLDPMIGVRSTAESYRGHITVDDFQFDAEILTELTHTTRALAPSKAQAPSEATAKPNFVEISPVTPASNAAAGRW